MSHEKLKAAAIEAIEYLMSDVSVSNETTVESLEEIQSNIQTTIESIKYDIDRANKK